MEVAQKSFPVIAQHHTRVRQLWATTMWIGVVIGEIAGCRPAPPPPAKAVVPASTSPTEQFAAIVQEQIKEFQQEVPGLELAKEFAYNVEKTNSMVSPLTAYYTISGRYPVSKFVGNFHPHHGTVNIDFRVEFAWQGQKWVRKDITYRTTALNLTPDVSFGEGTAAETQERLFRDWNENHVGETGTARDYSNIWDSFQMVYAGVSPLELLETKKGMGDRSALARETNSPDATASPSGKSAGDEGRLTLNEIVEKIREMDGDKDGQISRSEATGRIGQAFDRIDDNGDGKLDHEELRKALADQRNKSPQGRRK